MRNNNSGDAKQAAEAACFQSKQHPEVSLDRFRYATLRSALEAHRPTMQAHPCIILAPSAERTQKGAEKLILHSVFLSAKQRIVSLTSRPTIGVKFEHKT